MTSHEIRKAFLDFFEKRGHLIVPSAPLVAKNDPTLMFNNSGMAQFKDFFLGNGNPPSKRIADTQKCLRVSGKHNDLEEVGFDTYHHTMFEMLGNWSFGDYFKKEALAWSWELLTEVYKLPKDRIYVSVFEGNPSEGVPFDQEAFDIWKSIIGDENRIILGNKKDNFWEMGDIGPCGPCSEIHIDLRDQEEVDQISGKELVNKDHPQVVEIWNNVFMQYERKADGTLIPLPEKHVDTGMGFERLCMAIQGKKSNYDTDLFQNTIQVIEQLSGFKYGVNGTLSSDNYVDVAMRVIADHLRAVSFAISDGQLPSNAKAGYVIRRILRRALRYGYSYLNFREPFMCKLVPVLAKQFADVFPELQAQVDFVSKVVEEEEKTFLRTLEQGLKRLDVLFKEDKGEKLLSGETVFELSDTFGFPVDLTALIAREKGFGIDEEGYKKALEEQKARSRKDAQKEAADWVELGDTDAVEFLGYDQLSSTALLTKYRISKTKQGQEIHVVLDQTPFYAEMGGQVGDTGTITIGDQTLHVSDTRKENDLFIHVVKDKNAAEILSGYEEPVEVFAQVNAERRKNIEKNHTATHLMLAALKEVLGSHIVQRGSYQNDELTRFDFSHFAKVTDEELKKVEDIVNEKIRANILKGEKRNVPFQEAVDMGATATFGEKYGDFVRVITFDPNYSIELCGGTHVNSTGEIGLFRFISEGSVSAGVRRVEAVTGVKALELMREQAQLIQELKDLLKATDLLKAVETLKAENAQFQKRIEMFENASIQAAKVALLSKVENVNGMNVVAARVNVPHADGLKTLAFGLKQGIGKPVVILGAVINDKPSLAILIDENVVKEKNLNAGTIIREVAKLMKGGGGGQPHFATAGGSDVKGLDDAIEAAKASILGA
ncbi:alanyl-tRNA synthetase [Leadbetterella byssophila DSM 17132]|uniref:Alanine--tRNA ligase n=1 Tax=Leadbetterella byssophila (strain DSM 17132 / JCM 16389 / KACC 11308 / NBRC 106382 / 4M15) TaxID=649349 RepID=E4RZ44_LEAB4|nr:alanine--tRNA ligase [Leadbetterella byssophila]ADQ19162.1 alanyl-tRNA synthetase [Leadbetterella byssophila DSM 17132]